MRSERRRAAAGSVSHAQSSLVSVLVGVLALGGGALGHRLAQCAQHVLAVVVEVAVELPHSVSSTVHLVQHAVGLADQALVVRHHHNAFSSQLQLILFLSSCKLLTLLYTV